jgi:hypothetical protein
VKNIVYTQKMHGENRIKFVVKLFPDVPEKRKLMVYDNKMLVGCLKLRERTQQDE